MDDEPERSRSSFGYPLPNDRLRAAVDAAWRLFAKALQVNQKRVKGMFAGDFKGEVSQWGNGKKPSNKSQLEFTEMLIRIFSGTEPDRRLKDPTLYAKAKLKIIVSPADAPTFQKLVELLTEYLQELRQDEDSHSMSAARRGFSDAIGGRPIPKNGAERVAENAGMFGNAMIQLANFPQHIRDIANLVRGARESVVIHADAIDYGSFRNFAAHRDLLDAIIDRARAGKTVEILIWHDRQPMSWANRFKSPDTRSSPEFLVFLREFLAALRKRTDLSNTNEYKIVEDCLQRRSDWVSPAGDIRKLMALQIKYHELALAELKTVGVSPRGSNKYPDLTASDAERDKEAPTQFYWIADGARGIIVQPTFGIDAPAGATGNQFHLHTLLTNFSSIYNRQD